MSRKNQMFVTFS